MQKYLSEVKLLDLLHGHMPSQHEINTNSRSRAVAETLQLVIDDVRLGKADDETPSSLEKTIDELETKTEGEAAKQTDTVTSPQNETGANANDVIPD
mgnify:CR=1 FL=1